MAYRKDSLSGNISLEAAVSEPLVTARVLSCTCRGTMPYDSAYLGKACGGELSATELCRADMSQFIAAMGKGPLLVTCTQEAATFRETQAEHSDTGALDFVNIRETAGWSTEAAEAYPKIAALVSQAMEAFDTRQAPTVSQKSDGVILVYGSGDDALDAADALADVLDVTVMLTDAEHVMPRSDAAYPIVSGIVRQARGHLGAFELTIDRYAPSLPFARRAVMFDTPRDGAQSRCDLVLDLSGGTPMFPAHTKRDGYLRPDPRDPIAVQKALRAVASLTGVFDKPRYVTGETRLCAHSRNGRTGCTRCLDACPTGAIARAGDTVTVDPHLCAGCGSCVAICPTTAMRWNGPDAKSTVHRLRALLTGYFDAGGTEPPVLLLHDVSHGTKLIEALARAGDGLPARVLPVCEPRVVGLDVLAAACAYGVAELRILTGPSAAGDRDAMLREIELLDAILVGLGYGNDRVALIETDDPFALGEALHALARRPGPVPSRFIPLGDKREITMQALNALHAAATADVDTIALPPRAPIGTVRVADGCTLCLSCVSVCPTSALRDGQDRPALRFIEDECVQCGLCATTCPERVITLEPRATFGASRRETVLLREEEPALCVSCGTPFGVRSSIERVVAQLSGKHWMFSDPAIAARLRMCADCRVIAQTQRGLDPYAGPPRPKTRTGEDP